MSPLCAARAAVEPSAPALGCGDDDAVGVDPGRVLSPGMAVADISLLGAAGAADAACAVGSDAVGCEDGSAAIDADGLAAVTGGAMSRCFHHHAAPLAAPSTIAA